MKNWSGCSIFLRRFLKLVVLLWAVAVLRGYAQGFNQQSARAYSSFLDGRTHALPAERDTSLVATYPDPHQVLYKSLIIPGWGQVINKQIWKVPIIYALLGGLTGYSIYLTKQYHDYRAAYYNLNPQNNQNDQRFGATPLYLQNANISSLKQNRNSLHNRRDFIYVTIFLAYALNAVDAYVFAQLRSFDVSEDLSVRTSVAPHILAGAEPAPGLTLSFKLFNQSR